MYSLTQGDIIIFKAQDSWFSRAIALLSRSDVCHAAMVYSKDSIVEVLANGIQVNKVSLSKGDDIYVLRLSDEPDYAPLIRSADAYLQAGTRYDFPGLLILAGLLIYRYIVPTYEVLKIANHIFDAACLELDKMIQHALHYESRAMVCSQLIYQIFYDCGEPYKIKLPGSCLWSGSTDNSLPGFVRLAEYLSPDNDTLTDCPSPLVTPKSSLMPLPEAFLYKELCTALTNADAFSFCNKKPSKDLLTRQLSDSLPHAERFLSRLKHFLKLIQCDTPMDAMFVTPGDILNHSANLKQIAMITLKRSSV